MFEQKWNGCCQLLIVNPTSFSATLVTIAHLRSYQTTKLGDRENSGHFVRVPEMLCLVIMLTNGALCRSRRWVEHGVHWRSCLFHRPLHWIDIPSLFSPWLLFARKCMAWPRQITNEAQLTRTIRRLRTLWSLPAQRRTFCRILSGSRPFAQCTH